MKSERCENCGASRENYVKCTYCKSIFVRRDKMVRNPGFNSFAGMPMTISAMSMNLGYSRGYFPGHYGSGELRYMGEDE